MKTAKRFPSRSSDPVEYWDELLRPLLKKSPEMAKRFLADVRGAKLTFGDRVHCPFLRPVFLNPQDEQRVLYVAETIAAIAERVTAVALEDEALFRQFRLRPGPNPRAPGLGGSCQSRLVRAPRTSGRPPATPAGAEQTGGRARP